MLAHNQQFDSCHKVTANSSLNRCDELVAEFRIYLPKDVPDNSPRKFDVLERDRIYRELVAYEVSITDLRDKITTLPE